MKKPGEKRRLEGSNKQQLADAGIDMRVAEMHALSAYTLCMGIF